MHRNLFLAWSALVVLTFGSFAVGIEQSDRLAAAATVVIISAAMIKVRLIGLYFMDLRIAPRGLRFVFDAYVGLVFIGLTVLALPVGI